MIWKNEKLVAKNVQQEKIKIASERPVMIYVSCELGGIEKMKLSEAINGWGQPVYVCYFTKDGIKWFFKKIVREGIIDKEHAKEVVKNMIPDEKDDDIYPF